MLRACFSAVLVPTDKDFMGVENVVKQLFPLFFLWRYSFNVFLGGSSFGTKFFIFC